jgi:hypothetical protein
MNAQRYSKGPWRAIDGEIIGDTRYVAKVYDWSTPVSAEQYREINDGLKAESVANAQFIAAAPELAEALRSLLLQIEVGNLVLSTADGYTSFAKSVPADYARTALQKAGVSL